jgi:hypothetical protein
VAKAAIQGKVNTADEPDELDEAPDDGDESDYS